MTYCVDANLFITAWNVHYPIAVGLFRPVWDALEQDKERIQIIKSVYDEIDPISSSDRKELSRTELQAKYPLRVWLESNGFEPVQIGDDDQALALNLRREYQVEDNSKGIGLVDTLLIAYAKNRSFTVVTYEGFQNQPPTKRKNFRIPLVCQREGIRCITAVQLLQELEGNG